MNNRRTRHFARIVVTQLSIALLMFFIGLSIVFYAHGYRFRLRNFKIVKTGIVFVVSNHKNAEVYINNALVSQKMPYSKNLLPGHYDIEIKKKGAKSWKDTVNIEAEYVSDFKNIVLFNESPEIVEITDESKIRLVNAPIDSLATTGSHVLSHNSHEIWVNDKLITRFSKQINKAAWYPDYKHVVFQQGEEIRVIETAGTNDTLLIRLSSNQPVNFAVSKDGSEIYYFDDGSYKSAKIR